MPDAAARGFPFPVETPYRMRADLARLDGPAVPRLPDEATLLAAKREALRMRPDRIRAADPERAPEDVARDVAAGLGALARVRPDVVRPAVPDDASTLHGAYGAWTARDPGGRAWTFPTLAADDPTLHARPDDPPWAGLADAAALALPEDLVWMRDDGGPGRASLLHVAFPSHWEPERRGGASLHELHAPVADGERLRAASTALMRAIARKGPFRRHVWSLNPTASLDRHPRALAEAGAPAGPAGGTGVADTFFRVEVQTTLPNPDAGVALFLIRVRVAPLAEVLDEAPGRAGRLAASIRSMSPAVRAYKGVREADRLLRELDEWDESRF